MSREVLHDFDDGHGLTDSQRNTLGIWVPDAEDGFWCYGQYWENGDYKAGHVVRHAAGADLLSDADGVVNEAIAAGKRILTTDGKFASKDVTGAIGYIYEGAGLGQHFVVTRMIPGDNDSVEIQLIASDTKRPRTTGWETALATTSKFRLRLPGRFYFHDGNASDLTAGVCQTEFTVTDDYKPYGWAKCEGGAFALQDDSDANTPLAQGDEVIPLDGGLVTGPAGTPTIANRRLAIGFAEHAGGDGTADNLVAVTLTHIRPIRPSRSREQVGHTGNTVNVV